MATGNQSKNWWKRGTCTSYPRCNLKTKAESSTEIIKSWIINAIWIHVWFINAIFASLYLSLQPLTRVLELNSIPYMHRHKSRSQHNTNILWIINHYNIPEAQKIGKKSEEEKLTQFHSCSTVFYYFPWC